MLDACWGKGEKTRDVTDFCQSMVSGDSLTIPVNPQAFGEPDHWNSLLRIVFSNGTGIKSEALEEGVTLQVGGKVTSFIRYSKGLRSVDVTSAELRKAHPTGLLILDAQWGKEDKIIDTYFEFPITQGVLRSQEVSEVSFGQVEQWLLPFCLAELFSSPPGRGWRRTPR